MPKKEEIKDIDYALIAQAHTPMYLIHKYWARKPHNVVAEYIKHYSRKGEIVLDPFSGSGVTAIEAIKAGRKAAAFDLNPVSTFILENTLVKLNPQEIEAEFKKIQANLKDKINELYETKCPKCGQKIAAICLHWKKDKPIKIMFECDICKIKRGKDADGFDIKKIKEAAELKPKWFPKTELSYNGNKFMKREGKETIADLFTKRNLYALSLLYDEIEKIENKKMQNVFKFAFTSMTHLASSMTPVRPTRQFSSFWALQSYWTPPLFMESNVWMLFESAVLGKQGILTGKEDAASQISVCKRAKNFKELDDGANILFETANALELTKMLPDNSVDYIFTDPPYGGAVQYFELSTLWAAWLKLELNYADEITINSQQQKDFDYYHKMLKSAFREMYQVLKPNRYLTVTFHSTDIGVWNSIIKAVVLSGFDLEKIVYQPPARPSAKGLLQPYGSAVGDYYIRFKKPEAKHLLSEKEMDKETYEREAVMAAKHILEERGEPTIYQHILNGIMVELKGGRDAPIGARNIEAVLKDHVGKEFELIDAIGQKGRRAGKKWWLKGRDFSNFSTPALSDRVEKVVLNVLDKKVKASFDDVLQEIFIEFPNALTPEAQSIASIMEEYAARTPDGNWRLKPGSEQNQRESAHNFMVYCLAALGKKAGYGVWIGSQEQKFKVGNKPLSEICDKIRVFRFVPQESQALERIKQIDVLWLEDGKIRYMFEVETTTGISEAIIRGSNVPDDLNPKRFIIIPEEREKFLFKKIQEPVLAETLKKTRWNFIRYKDLEVLFKRTKKTFDAKELDNLAKMPKDCSQEQTDLNHFA